MRTLELSHNDWRQSHKLILNINIVHTLDKRKEKKGLFYRRQKNYSLKDKKHKLNLPMKRMYITT